MNNKVTFEMIKEAKENLKGVIDYTPIISASNISKNVFFKAENLQKTGSFKIRGSYNKISSLTEEELSKGVIACSSGNHAQGVALSASKKGIKSVVCMPTNAPLIKKEATENYGAEVISVDGVYDDAAREANRLSKENGYVFIHPFDDPYIIAGQGTLGIEIIEQMPDVEQVIVPIGGGGLISGISIAIKALKPDCKIIGVQAKGVPSMYGSLKENHVVTVSDATTVADGIHVLTPGDLTFEIVKENVDEIVTVDEDEICAAIVELLQGPKIVAEGASATTLAAFKYANIDTSKKTVCLISGGNIELNSLERILTIGNIKLGRIFAINIELEDNAESLSKLLSLLASKGIGGVDIRRQYVTRNNDINFCNFHISFETKDIKHCKDIKETLIENNYNFSVI